MSYPDHVPYFSDQSVPAARVMQHSPHPAIPASIVSMQQLPNTSPVPSASQQQQLQAMMASQMQQMAVPMLPFNVGGNTSPFLSSIPAPPTVSPSPSPFASPAVPHVPAMHASTSTPALPTATMPGAPPPPTPVSAVLVPQQASNNKVKKAWSEAERNALRDSVIKYRTKKNQHKLPWKLILNDTLYSTYRQDRSKDAIMQQWKTLKKEVADIPIPEGESDTDDGTDSESEGSNVSSPQLPALPSLPKPSSQRSKWTAEDTQALSEAIAQYGTDWRLILKDPVFAKRLKYRNAVSLGKNYHRFHPAGIESKRASEEAKRAKKEAKDEKAALDELSSTSEEEEEDEDKPERRTQLLSTPGAANAAGNSGSSSKAIKHKRADSDSDSDSSDTSSNESTDDDSSPPASPQFISATGVDAPIQAWEKPDERSVAHFRRCRHVCGCKSLTADGREFVNNQAVMVRGSRRNHEVNQNLHPNCRQAAKACERLLGPLKDKKGKGLGGLGDEESGGGVKEEGMDMDGDEDDGDEDELGTKESSKKKRKRDRDANGGLLNGQHGNKEEGKELKGDDSHDAMNPFVFSTSPFVTSQPSVSNPAAIHISSLLAQLESMTHTVLLVQSAQQSAGGSYAELYERLLERSTKQEEEIAELKSEIARLTGVKREDGVEPHSELSVEPVEQDEQKQPQHVDRPQLHSEQVEDGASDMQPGAVQHIPLDPIEQQYSPQPGQHMEQQPSHMHIVGADNSVMHVKSEPVQHMAMETQEVR